MTNSGIALPIDASGGSPAFTAADTRVAFAALMTAGAAGRRLGSASGIRAGVAPVISVTGTTWSVGAFNGFIDPGTASTVGPYLLAFTSTSTGAITAADASNPRIDRLDVMVPDDPAGSDPLNAWIQYTAGVAASSPSVPAAPARSFPLGTISVPKSGGGAPSFTATYPYAVASGGITPAAASAQYPPSPTEGQYVDDATLNALRRYTGSRWDSVSLCGICYGDAVGTTAITFTATGTFYSFASAAVTFTLAEQRRVRVVTDTQITGTASSHYFAKAQYNTGASTNVGTATGIGASNPLATPTAASATIHQEGTVVLAAGTYTVFPTASRTNGTNTDQITEAYCAVYDCGPA